MSALFKILRVPAKPSGLCKPAVATNLLARRYMSEYEAPEAFFGCNSFTPAQEKKYLPVDAVEQVAKVRKQLTGVPDEIADHYANGLFKWASERGATHYAHWFQPLSGAPAMKHDTFFNHNFGNPISEFSGKTLIRGEPDGSSFPNGCLRDTHTARGHTAWDPHSHPFVLDHGNGATLFIPSVFYTWDGHSIDEKLPLLRSAVNLKDKVLSLLHAAGQTQHSTVHSDSGLEQEFFLIDREYYNARRDLVLTGRTIHGAPSPKGQEMSDQYFGQISDRMLNVLNDCEIEAFKLGIPMCTRHREVAPGQYEVAPSFGPTGLTSDQNSVLMTIFDRVAIRHGVQMLFHEKPFADLNGSGKHNNWSIGTDKIGTVFNPGSKPSENTTFMMFVAATLKMVDQHADLLRVSIASYGNDFRLGGHEAPPAIVSVYLGDDIELAVDSYVTGNAHDIMSGTYDLGAPQLPNIDREPTDRNRTSPFAYTGMKFEFRATGSDQTVHFQNTILNTCMADAAAQMTDAINKYKADGKSTEEATKFAITDCFKEHRRIIFHGDGYSAEWPEEAKARGLPNLADTPTALSELSASKNIQLFSEANVLSEDELLARQEVAFAKYAQDAVVEGKCMINIIKTVATPAGLSFFKEFVGVDSSAFSAIAESKDTLAGVINQAYKFSTSLEALVAEVESIGDASEQAKRAVALRELVIESRDAVDKIESMVPATSWPLPTYDEMLFNQD